MKASDIQVGQFVKHSGEFHKIIDVRIRGVVVEVITGIGGRVAFMTNSTVEIL